MTITNPCYKCPRRKATCHATCEAYKAYTEAQVELRHKRRIDGILTSMILNNKCAERRPQR